jgi:hypothetical protein
MISIRNLTCSLHHQGLFVKVSLSKHGENPTVFFLDNGPIPSGLYRRHPLPRARLSGTAYRIPGGESCPFRVVVFAGGTKTGNFVDYSPPETLMPLQGERGLQLLRKLLDKELISENTAFHRITPEPLRRWPGLSG